MLTCRQMEPIIQAAIVGGAIVWAAHNVGNGLKRLGMDTVGHIRNHGEPCAVPAQLKDGQAPKPR